MPTAADAQRKYDEYNAIYFEGKLPGDVEIRFIRGLKDETGRELHGQTTPMDEGAYLIELAAGMAPDLYRLTLCHECVHVKLHARGFKCWRSHRSKIWKKEVQRLANLGYLLEIF